MGCIILDDSVVESPLINSTEKLVYGIISSLANKRGYCYAKNEYIANKLNTTTRTITKSISKLKKAKYIRVENVDYQRRIYLIKSMEE